MQIDHGGVHNRIAWKVDIQKVRRTNKTRSHPVRFGYLLQTDAPHRCFGGGAVVREHVVWRKLLDLKLPYKEFVALEKRPK